MIINPINLYKLNDVTYIDINDIVFLQLLPMSDKLTIVFRGGSEISISNGKHMLEKLKTYIQVLNLED